MTAAFGGMVDAAYATFRHPAVCPLTQIGDNLFVLELFHGPTLAFKDVAMQLLGRLMDHVLEARGQRATIVGATSGDTGGAAIEAFRGLKRVDIFILYPQGRVSEVQRRQMTTVAADNVHAIAVEGDFDDCQALVKAMFNHHAFRDEMGLSGVNSINWARIVAQIVYYFTAAVSLGAPHRPVSFSVPTGNFGDVLAGWVRQAHGPADRACSTSRPTPTTSWRAPSQSGRYEITGVVPTTSPSMDIQVSSNFERLLFEAHGRDGAAVRRHDGLARPVAAPSPSPTARWPRSGASSRPARRRRGRGRGRDGGHVARGRLSARSAHGDRRRRRAAACSGATRRRPWWCSAPPIPPSSPTR